jgi:peptidylprolyl isomerase
MPTDKRERQRAARVAKAQVRHHQQKRSATKKRVRNVAIVLALALIAAFAFSLTASDDDPATDTAASSTTSTAFAYADPELAEEVLNREPPEATGAPADTARDALETETLIEGEGVEAVEGDAVLVHYVGALPDGEVFDESWSRGEPIAVQPLGSAPVILGWNQGLVGAKIGERRRLVIGSDKAYGEQGSDCCPPNTPLEFVIDVVDIRPAGA